MKKLLTVICAMVFLFAGTPAAAQTYPTEYLSATESAEMEAQVPDVFPKDEYYRGKIISAGKDVVSEFQGYKSVTQDMTVKLLDGPEKNKTIQLKYNQLLNKDNIVRPKVGDTVVITKSTLGDEPVYVISDKYRLDTISYLLIAFFIMVIIFGRWKGLTSTVGLGVSILIIVYFIVPKIVSGSNPFVITMIGILIISFTSLYLAHGFNKRTTIALIATLITLGLSILLARLAVDLTQLNGLGSEEAMFLQAGVLGSLNLKGLLLGGILIGTLGVLDDITTSQSAAIDEISKANPSLKFGELYERGLSVGHEHIASLVNTLFLAYAGASLPLFILLSQAHGQPMWAVVNSEQFVEEIVRTIVGSIALILGVPISTLLTICLSLIEKSSFRAINGANCGVPELNSS